MIRCRSCKITRTITNPHKGGHKTRHAHVDNLVIIVSLLKASEKTTLHSIEAHGNLLSSHITGVKVKVVAEIVRENTVKNSGVVNLNETHPILGGSELDNRVSKGARYVSKVKGKKYTTILKPEYYVTSYIREVSEKEGPEAIHSDAHENGTAYFEDAENVTCEDMVTALTTHVNNETGIT